MCERGVCGPQRHIISCGGDIPVFYNIHYIATLLLRVAARRRVCFDCDIQPASAGALKGVVLPDVGLDVEQGGPVQHVKPAHIHLHE